QRVRYIAKRPKQSTHVQETARRPELNLAILRLLGRSARTCRMNESRFAVKRFVNDTRPVGMLLPCFGFRIKPVRQNERPSAIVCHSPIFRDTGQVKSQVEAHDHSLIEYRFEKHFLYELG